ncbi:unnamed protein product, partial [Polarella glacialis]
ASSSEKEKEGGGLHHKRSDASESHKRRRTPRGKFSQGLRCGDHTGTELSTRAEATEAVMWLLTETSALLAATWGHAMPIPASLLDARLAAERPGLFWSATHPGCSLPLATLAEALLDEEMATRHMVNNRLCLSPSSAASDAAALRA